MGAANHIEQRWSQRKLITLAVEIVDKGVKIATSHTRDVGLGGVFLELESISREPKEDQDVELEFFVTRGDDMIRHRLRAKVMRITSDGIGLMFREFDTGTFRALQEIMRYQPADTF